MINSLFIFATHIHSLATTIYAILIHAAQQNMEQWTNKNYIFFFYFDHAQDMHCTTTTTTIDENKFNYLVDNSSNVLPLDSVLNLSIALYCFNMYIYILKCIIIVELQRQ